MDALQCATISPSVARMDIITTHLAWMESPAANRGRRYSPATIAERRRVLLYADRHLPSGIDDVDHTEIEAILAVKGWKRWTSHTYRSHLVGFYRWAYATGELTADPTVGLGSFPGGKALPKPVAPEEIAHALAHSPEPWHSAIMLALCAGMRASELSAAEREHITAQLTHIPVGKGGKERYVDTCTSLWDYVKDRPPGRLVRWRSGRPITHGHDLSRAQQQHWRRIGLPDWHLHRLRHTFCTVMWQSDANPLAIRDLMGHESLLTTQGYSVVALAQRRKAVSAIDALLAESRPDCGRPGPAAA